MARLVGVDLPREKRVEVALTYIFGVGRTSAQKALAATGVNPDTRVKDLTDAELVQLRDYIEGNFKVEDVETKPLKRNPAPPFTTSTLQQEASRKLGFTTRKTMQVAQKL